MNKRDLRISNSASLNDLVVSTTLAQRYAIDPVDNEKFTVEMAIVPKGSDVLLVSLHGGVTLGNDRLPRFEWLRTLADRPENQLYISDPTLRLDDQLLNGWYVGDDDEDLTPRLASIIQEVARQTDSKYIVLLGSSAGGFAAARIGHLLAGSVALAFSTQRNLGFGPVIHVPDFLRLVFPHDSGYESVHRRIGSRVSLEETLFEAPGTQFVWVQNTGDVEHMRDHFLPFLEASKVRAEMFPGGDKVQLVRKYYGPGHPVPPLGLFNASIDASIEFARTSRFNGIPWQDHAPNPPADVAFSSDVVSPTFSLPRSDVRHTAGSIKISGKASAGDVVALKIGKTIYQCVYVNADGTWTIDQSFAPAPAWNVSVFSYRANVGVSEEVTLVLHVEGAGN